MTGLGTEEPVYQPAKIDQLLGSGKSGDVLRNLLVEANNNQHAWEALQQSIHELFGYVLQGFQSRRHTDRQPVVRFCASNDGFGHGGTRLPTRQD